MHKKVCRSFLYVLATVFFLASIGNHLVPYSIPDEVFLPLPIPLNGLPYNPQNTINQAIHEDAGHPTSHRESFVPETTSSFSSVSILFPDWEVLVVVSPETAVVSDSVTDEYVCLYHNNETSPAKPAGILPFPDRATFKCVLPDRVRRQVPFLQPVLAKFPGNPPMRMAAPPEIFQWNYLIYDSLSTENDVVLFVKGVIKRQGVNRDPTEFRCVFGDEVNGVRTAVTSSSQEVFRCQHPELTAVSLSPVDENQERIKVSLEFWAEKQVVPSIAYYHPSNKIASQDEKSLLCACTMVYNVAKFLKEWVVYHSKIGVEKFILYDNGSDDDLNKIVEELIQEGYNVKTHFWLWPKTQEAGFSHCAVNAKDSCRWMAYIDVDEFIYSPSWSNSSIPSKSMLKSLLPKPYKFEPIGQIRMGCYEFGPSNQKSNPIVGVTQGYNCRRKRENRHKSIVLLDAIDDSLLNVVHHFRLKEGYKGKKLNIKQVVVNHYKFQAWTEFKAKFKRRVSAYVVDWTHAGNPNSNDRTPGLGLAPIEPKGWPEKFCEVYDEGLKELTHRWFGVESESGYHMAWQR